MTGSKRLLIGSAIILCLLGITLSAYLLYIHALGKTSGSMLQRFCGASGLGCDRVLTSRWSVFPPRPRFHESPTGAATAAPSPRKSVTGLHIPLPVLGLAYFSFLTAWFIGVGCPNRLGRRWQMLPFAVLLAGNLCSVAFIYVMAAILKTFCLACLSVHAANLLLLTICILTRPRRLAATAQAATGPGADSLPTVPSAPHPTCRLAGVTIALGITLWIAGAAFAAALAAHSRALMLGTIVEDVAKHPEVLMALYEKQPRQVVNARPDDPVQEYGRGNAEIVVFSDMTCAACRDFEILLDAQVRPLFGDGLRVVFKHFPLSGHCNRAAGSRGFAHSCKAAYAAEAARLQGGNEAFWKMLRMIRDRSDDIESFDYVAAAERLGLDRSRFNEDVRSPAVRQRIQEDAELGARLGVEATPGVFFNGRLVPAFALQNVDLWKALAASVSRKPAATQPAKSEAVTTQPRL